MKKLLSFLFAFFLISTNAFAATNEIVINQHAPGYKYSSSVIGNTNITSNIYHIYKDDELIWNFSKSTNISNAPLGMYRIIEEESSYGYLPYVKFDYTFELTSSCPKINIDIEKSLIYETIAIENKNGINTNISVFNSSNNRIEFIQNNLKYQELSLIYDDYSIFINGEVIPIHISEDTSNEPILYDNNFYQIRLITNDSVDLVEPLITITQSCFNGDELVNTEYTYKKEILNENIEDDNTLIDDCLDDYQIETDIKAIDGNIEKNMIVENQINESDLVVDEIIDIKPDISTIINNGSVESNDHNVNDYLKNSNIIKKSISNSKGIIDPDTNCISDKGLVNNVIDNDTDDLIIDYGINNEVLNNQKKINIRKSSMLLLPLISLVLAFLWYKKSKKVQKK